MLTVIRKSTLLPEQKDVQHPKLSHYHHWVFYGQVNEQSCYLTQASHVPIKRHVKIQSEANPYDPLWEVYFEKRLDAHMGATAILPIFWQYL